MSSNKTVIVTGASSGLGFAMAKAFLDLGYNVVGNARTQERLDAAAAELGNPDRFLGVAGDISLRETAERLLDHALEAFGKVDALLTPTAPSAAFALGDRSDDPVAMYLNDIFTVTVNLAGLPGMSVPAGLDASGLPLGLQLIGRALDEGTLFSLGGALEKAADFRAKPQKWW